MTNGITAKIVRRFLRHIAAATAVAFALVGLVISYASADHGEGHNGETMALSADTDLVDGQTVTVELSSWLPDATITVVTCYNYPAVGPTDCNLSNYGQHFTKAAADGTATVEYPVAVIPGRCDHDNPCFIVAGDGIGGAANFAAVPVTFAVVEVPTTTTTEAPTTTTTEAPATTTTEPPTTTEAAAAEVPADDGNGSSTGLIVVAVVVAAVVVVAGGGYLLHRRRSA